MAHLGPDWTSGLITRAARVSGTSMASLTRLARLLRVQTKEILLLILSCLDELPLWVRTGSVASQAE